MHLEIEEHIEMALADVEITNKEYKIFCIKF